MKPAELRRSAELSMPSPEGALIIKLLDFSDAFDVWCKAKCSHPLVVNGEVSEERARREQTGEEFCDGANHLEDCPVELARQDVLSASQEIDRS